MAVLSDPISDFLTRLKNASLAGNEEFTAPCSNIKVKSPGFCRKKATSGTMK